MLCTIRCTTNRANRVTLKCNYVAGCKTMYSCEDVKYHIIFASGKNCCQVKQVTFTLILMTKNWAGGNYT